MAVSGRCGVSPRSRARLAPMGKTESSNATPAGAGGAVLYVSYHGQDDVASGDPNAAKASANLDIIDAATDTLSPAVFAAGVRTLIGLLAATGIRSGEAFALDLVDLDVDQSLLLVCGKQAKKRLVPLHASTLEAVVEYQKLRPRPGRSGKLPLLFGNVGAAWTGTRPAARSAPWSPAAASKPARVAAEPPPARLSPQLRR